MPTGRPKEVLEVALPAARQAHLDAHADQLDETGKGPVVGNGYAKERAVTTGAGMVEVKVPAVASELCSAVPCWTVGAAGSAGQRLRSLDLVRSAARHVVSRGQTYVWRPTLTRGRKCGPRRGLMPTSGPLGIRS